MHIKNTTSLCPICLKPLDAEVYEEDGRVWIKKECPEHGEFNNTYWSDAELYNRVDLVDSITQDLENPMVEKVAKTLSKQPVETLSKLLTSTPRTRLAVPSKIL